MIKSTFILQAVFKLLPMLCAYITYEHLCEQPSPSLVLDHWKRPLQINLEFLVLRSRLFFHDSIYDDYAVTSVEKMTVV